MDELQIRREAVEMSRGHLVNSVQTKIMLQGTELELVITGRERANIRVVWTGRLHRGAQAIVTQLVDRWASPFSVCNPAPLVGGSAARRGSASSTVFDSLCAIVGSHHPIVAEKHVCATIVRTTIEMSLRPGW